MQKTILLTDSDNNAIMALVEYNPEYVQDFKVLYAQVELKVSGEQYYISNMEMLRYQYSSDIINQLKEG
jgi:hypothetical protein